MITTWYTYPNPAYAPTRDDWMENVPKYLPARDDPTYFTEEFIIDEDYKLGEEYLIVSYYELDSEKL